jgi:hypothetical protein
MHVAALKAQLQLDPLAPDKQAVLAAVGGRPDLTNLVEM